MYPWIWRHLPGPGWLKAVQSLVLFAAVVAVCFLWVFPELAPLVPINDGAVE